MSEGYRKGSTAEHEARYLLMKKGWLVIRWYGDRSPPDLFAIGKGAFLVLMVRSSRRPVPDAPAVAILYGEELERMRNIGIPASIPMECWVHAPPDGWKCYEILPGGIRRIWRKGIAPALEETPGSDRGTDEGLSDAAIESGLAAGGEEEFLPYQPETKQPLTDTGTTEQHSSFHGQEIKGYGCSTTDGTLLDSSLRKEAVNEEWLTSITSATISRAPEIPAPDKEPPQPPGVTGHA